MRPSAALAVALAVLALAGAAATLPAATSDAPDPADGADGPTGDSSDTDSSTTLPESVARDDAGSGCLVGCGSGDGPLDGLPALPAPGPGVLAVLAAGALAGLSLLAYRAAGDEGVAPDDADRRDESPGAPAGTATGGRPAPADAAADNAVYRAWLELVDGLAVPRADARTPAELAAAAVDAGADAAAVRELRGLFVAVRYGGRRPTGDREERARAAGRRADVDGDSADGSTDEADSAPDTDAEDGRVGR